MKKVSLMIPVYNAGDYLAEMLESVLGQTYPSIELILVNDGSTDHSADVFASYEERLKVTLDSVTFLSHAKNCSASSAMNTALPYCTGEYLMWADADDILQPENITKKVEFLEIHTDLVMVRSNGIQIDLKTGEMCELARPEDKKQQSVFENLMFSKTYCHCGCYMVRSDAFFNCYPNRRIPISRQGQNMQMLLPPASLSDCGYIDELLYVYRIHETNHSRSFVTYQQQLERYKGFYSLQMEVLPYCSCDEAVWDAKIAQYWKKEIANLQKMYLWEIRRKRNGEKRGNETESRDCNIS